MATLKDIALQTGLSVSAVSRVLNEPDFGTPETRKRVMEAVESLGYVRNYMATRMKDGKSRQIALVINDIMNPFFSNIARGVEDICSLHGYTLLLCNTDDNLHRENNYFDLIRGKLCDGFIVSVVSEEESRLEGIDGRETPFVMVSRRSQRVAADFVGFDEFAGAYAAVSHLISLGHRRIATLTGLLDSRPGQERQRGYESALRDHGIPVDQQLIRFCDFRSKSAYLQTKSLLKLESRPSAIFVANNLMTEGCLQCLTEEHIHIPEEMAVLAFFEPSWASIVTPPLTCVSADAYSVGRNAAELLFRRLDGYEAPPQMIQLPASLTIRESCGELLKK